MPGPISKFLYDPSFSSNPSKADDEINSGWYVDIKERCRSVENISTYRDPDLSAEIPEINTAPR